MIGHPMVFLDNRKDGGEIWLAIFQWDNSMRERVDNVAKHMTFPEIAGVCLGEARGSMVQATMWELLWHIAPFASMSAMRPRIIFA